MAVFLIQRKTVKVALVLLLELCLTDAQNLCIASFSGGTIRKHGDCQYRRPDRNDVFASIKAMAEEERRLNDATPTNTGTLRTSPSTSQNPIPSTTSMVENQGTPKSLNMEANISTTNEIFATTTMSDVSTLPSPIFAVEEEVLSSGSNPNCTIDVLFVLDGSVSVGASGFTIVKQWVKRFAREMMLLYPSGQIGVIQFSHYFPSKAINEQLYIKTEVALKNWNYTDFAPAVDTIQYHGYTTFTPAALWKAKYEFMNSKNFNISGYAKYMILFTDGTATEKEMLLERAEELRNIGVISFVYGVGGANMTEMRIIATGNVEDPQRTRLLEGFADLENEQLGWSGQQC